MGAESAPPGRRRPKKPGLNRVKIIGRQLNLCTVVIFEH